jgi:hypothetical protein
MLKLKKVLERPKLFKRLTGIEASKFPPLAKKVEKKFELARIKRLSGRKRKRKIGGGLKYKLGVDEALFMLLVYYRTYVHLLFLGTLFNIDESTAWRYVQRIEPLLVGIFKIPERRIDMTKEAVMELLIDATEQETEKRPGSGYSGKKKRQTIKTQMVVNTKGKIKAISKSVSGNRHDKNLYDKTRVITSVKVRRKGDLAYLGTACVTPIKKQPNKELTFQQKLFNRKFNRSRYPVERTFAHLKHYKVLAYRFRGRLTHYNLVFKNIAGLYNLQAHSV